MKMKYAKPELTKRTFGTEDIVTASGLQTQAEKNVAAQLDSDNKTSGYYIFTF